MEIDAPFSVGLVESETGQGHQLHITFSEVFRGMDSIGQAKNLEAYVATLREQTRATAPGSPEQQGMLTVLQLAQEMLPLIRAGEMNIDQTIVAEAIPEADNSQPLRHPLDS